MQIITITSDLGVKDNYVALVKAQILKLAPDVQIIDISNEIEKFNIIQASYVFGSAFLNFPEGTIHLLGVKSTQVTNSNYLLIEYHKQFIICPDNGIFTLFYKNDAAQIFKLNNSNTISTSFYLKDILAPVATEISNGKALNELGTEFSDYQQLLSFQPSSTPFSIIGRCLHMDSYGNVITNITKDFFDKTRKGRDFIIHLPGQKIEKISHTYEEVPDITALALFNSSNYLEIAINKGQARQLLFPKNINLHTDFNITVEFLE